VVVLLAPILIFVARTPEGEASLSVTVGTLADLVPTATDGLSVGFGSAAPAGGIYETVGWYPREAGFVWSQGMHQRLLILVDDTHIGQACDLRLALDVEGFVPTEDVGPRNLSLRATGTERAVRVPASRTRVEIPMSFVALPGTIVVDSTVDALKPRRYGSTDGRVLGIRLYSAELHGLTSCGAP
jgi:hypothetical protein